MRIKENETENRDYLLKKLHAILDGTFPPNIFLDKEVPIPYKHIYLPRDASNDLEIWCFKQDICLYEELFNKDIKYRDARIVSRDGDDILNVKLEKDSSQNSHHVGLPYVIIETKMGMHINTHELLAYSNKVQMIKTIFPYIDYCLLFFGRTAARAYRHGLDFDEIIEIDNLNKDTILNIANKIIISYNRANERINRILA